MGSLGSVEDLMMAMKAHHAQRKGRWLHQGLGLVISVLCLWLIVRQVRFDELRQALGQLDGRYIAFGLASLAFGYAIRIHRWAVMLRATGIRVSSRACAAPFLGSITLNNVLPFRAGDIVRALVFPFSLGVPRITATASLLLERLLDLLTLLLSLGIGLSLSARVGLPQWLGRSVILLSLLGAAALFVVVACHSLLTSVLTHLAKAAESQDRPRIAVVLKVARDLIHSLGQMSRPSTLLLLLALSFAVWAGEAGVFWALLEGFDIQAGIASALLIMAMATLSTLVPSSPGYVGPFHLAAFSAVTMLGGSPGQAASFAVLAHLGVWLPTTLAGGIAILANPGLFKARASRGPSF
jgi:uncharacterized protein (TIRG00374 family)